MKSAAVAIVGGGVVGASVAYHLTATGVRDVVVLDRGARPGSGSTSRATGGFRAQFETPVNVRLSLLARARLLSFRDETGVDPGYDPAGYLWIASSEREMSALRAALRVQRAEGLTDAGELASDDVPHVNDAVALDECYGATFCPTDGFIRPMEILRGYMSAAERQGARVEWNADVVSLELGESDRITAVQTSRGKLAVETVVNAAGAWAANVAALANVALPVTPLRRQVAVSAESDALPERMPMTIFTRDGLHMRPRDGRAVLCWPTPGRVDDPFDTSVDAEWLSAVVARARDRVPALGEARFEAADCYGGLYEMSPDSHAILGSAPGCENMFLANGSSGHGVMHAPAVGQLLAEIIVGNTPSMDVHPLRPSRFAEGDQNPDSWIL